MYSEELKRAVRRKLFNRVTGEDFTPECYLCRRRACTDCLVNIDGRVRARLANRHPELEVRRQIESALDSSNKKEA